MIKEAWIVDYTDQDGDRAVAIAQAAGTLRGQAFGQSRR